MRKTTETYKKSPRLRNSHALPGKRGVSLFQKFAEQGKACGAFAGIVLRLRRDGAGAGQQETGCNRGEGRDRDEAEAADQRLQKLAGHILVVEDVDQRRALRHKHHQLRQIAAGVGEQQRGGHRAHRGLADADAAAHGLPRPDAGLFAHDLADAARDVHREIDHRAGRADEYAGHEDARQVQVLIAGVQQRFALLHDGAVDVQQVCEHHAEHAARERAEHAAEYGGEAAPVKAVNEHDDDDGQKRDEQQAHQNGVGALQRSGDHDLPDGQHGDHKGEQGPETARPGKQNQEQCKDGCQQDLPADAVVVDHGDGGDGVVRMADDDQRAVAGHKHLVLLEAAAEQVDAGRLLPGEHAFLDAQGAVLLAVLDDAVVDDRGIVDLQHGCAHLFGVLIDQRAFVAGGHQQEHDGQQDAGDQHARRGGLFTPQLFEQGEDLFMHGLVLLGENT